MLEKHISLLESVTFQEADFFDGLNLMLNYVIDKIIFLGSTLAVLALIVCGIRIFIASDPRSVEESKRMAIWVIIGLCLLFGARLLVSTFARIATQTL